MVTLMLTVTVTVTVKDVPLLQQFCNGNVTVPLTVTQRSRYKNEIITVFL